MKNLHKELVSGSVQASLRISRSALLLGAAVAVAGSAVVVHADTYDDQIAAVQSQSNVAKGLLNGLESQADSYQGVIGQLQQQISTVQSQIAGNQAQQAAVQAQIEADQVLVTNDKAQLAATIKAMYLDGQITTIEELATSKDLSQYVDKEEYRTVVQNQLNGKITEIATLQSQLETQKTNLDNLVKAESDQNAQLGAAESQQASLLSYNQSQQSAYNSQLAGNASQIAKLRQEQIIANTRYNIGSFKSSPGNGGYPDIWANRAQDSVIDSWGMYNRECVSYTAFRVHQDYVSGKDKHDMPYWGGRGNANEWDDNARAAGIPVDTNPTVGSIAISNAGEFGHAMYVEAVNGNEIYVQQYNQQLNGQYSEGWRYTTGLVFIHF